MRLGVEGGAGAGGVLNLRCEHCRVGRGLPKLDEYELITDMITDMQQLKI